MTRAFIPIALLLVIHSCKTMPDKKQLTSKNLIENTLDFIIEHKNNTTIEFPFLYDSLTTKIANENVESLILAESLKKRGFTVTNWSRGYHPRGPFFDLTLQKDNCICEVTKIYYSTFSDTLYEMAERITCSDSLTFNKKLNNDK